MLVSKVLAQTETRIQLELTLQASIRPGPLPREPFNHIATKPPPQHGCVCKPSLIGGQVGFATMSAPDHVATSKASVRLSSSEPVRLGGFPLRPEKDIISSIYFFSHLHSVPTFDEHARLTTERAIYNDDGGAIELCPGINERRRGIRRAK